MKAWNCSLLRLLQTMNVDYQIENDIVIRDVSTISEPKDQTLLFATKRKWNAIYLENLKDMKQSVILVEPEIASDFHSIEEENEIIIVSNARLMFAKMLRQIVNDNRRNYKYKTIDNNITIGSDVKMGKNCYIEPNVFIDNNVVLGENVIIKAGAVIRSETHIGNNSVIGENSVIGAQGLGVENDPKTGERIRIPHIGGVVIGNNVEIGALTSICSGTIKPTVVSDNCFIDDLNHIAHNCFLGEGATTTGCVEMSGSSCIGDNSYLSPNCTIRNGIELGNNVFVGQASSVQKNFDDDTKLVGNPAREFVKKVL